MKNFIISLVVGGLLFGTVFAYQPTSQDISKITALKAQFDSITTDNMKDKWDFYVQLKTLQEQFTGHEQLTYYLDQLGIYLIAQINTEKVKTKASFKSIKQIFLDTYSGWFSQDITTPDSCTGRYNTMDTINFANNFPTAITIATRYRETNCGYYLPTNGDGPFQILSKDYGTGQLSEAKFLTIIQDFINFSKSKYGQHYSKIWPIFTYTGFDMTGIVNYAALYNGGTITWSLVSWYIVTPNNPKYAFDGYGSEYSWALRYGLVPKFLKILDWELKNTY